MKKYFKWLVVSSLLVLSACGSNPSISTSAQSSGSIPNSSAESTSTIPSTSVEIPDTSGGSTSVIQPSTSIPEPDQGYIDLPEDYFKYDSSETDMNKLKSKIALYSIEEGVERYSDARVYVDGEKIDLYSVLANTQHAYQTENYTRSPVGVGYIRLEGSADIIVHLPYDIDYNSTVTPNFYNIVPLVSKKNRTLKFTIKAPGQYAISINGDVTKVIYLFVDDFAKTDYHQTIDKDGANVVYFGPGIHDRTNDPRIDGDNTIYLASGQTLFIDYQAVVRAKIRASDASNIKIIGGGIIDGSTFTRNSHEVSVPLELTRCREVEMKGVSFLDPAGWTMSIYFCDQVKIDNIKIISSRANGDGISLQSSQNVEVTNTFVRSFDDSLVVKNYPNFDDRSIEGTTRNISFRNCVLWTDLAQSMEIGFETIGEVMEDIVFEDIVVLHNFHKPVISIHNGNNANIKNVSFKNITVEDASMGLGDGQNVLVDFSTAFSPTWSTNHKVTGLGSIDGVRIENVLVQSARNSNQNISIMGAVDKRHEYLGSIHPIKNVTISDFKILNELLTSSSPVIKTNSYVENLVVTSSGNSVKGATLPLDPDITRYGKGVEIFKF